jgi:membrane protein
MKAKSTSEPSNSAPSLLRRLPPSLQMPSEVLWLSWVDFQQDRGFHWAAALAYYGLLSIPPLLLVGVILAANFVDPLTAAASLTRFMGQFIPQGQPEIYDLVVSILHQQGHIGIYSMLFLLWSGTQVFSAIRTLLNIAFDADDDYSMVKSILIDLGMLLTLGTIYIIAQVAQFAIYFLAVLLEPKWATLGWLPYLLIQTLPALILFSAYYLVFRYVPRRQVKSRAAAGGAALSTIAYLIAQPVFIRYLEYTTYYNLVYGSLALVVILVFWAWIAAVILLFGGELAAHIQTLVLEHKTPQAVIQQHIERSPKNSRQKTLPPDLLLGRVMALEIVTIYIQVLGETNRVYRPAQGERLSATIFRVLPVDRYGSQDEQWEFPPGSVVRCEKQPGEDRWIAVEGIKIPKSTLL